MDGIDGRTLKMARSRASLRARAIVGLGLMLTATGAKAGCAIPAEAGAAPAIPFASPNRDEE